MCKLDTLYFSQQSHMEIVRYNKKLFSAVNLSFGDH
jgi:hypothetical protein